MNTEQRITILEQKLIALQITLEQYFEKIDRLEKTRIVLDSSDYRPEATVINKIKLVITEINMPCNIRMIIEGLNQLDKTTLLSQRSPNKYLSPFLKRAIGYGVLKKIEVKGVKSHIYCLPEWFEEDELKEEYKIHLPRF